MTSIKVYGRIRPGKESESPAIEHTERCVSVINTEKSTTSSTRKTYELHRIFGDTATQEEVFVSVAKKIVEDSVEGFNGTVFAYGQTGSGKTHTMLGPSDDDSWTDPDRKGLIPRSTAYLFDLLDERSRKCQKFSSTVQVQFVELYNEEIFDLLNSKSKVLLRDSGSCVLLSGAATENVDSSLDMMHVIRKGWQSRSTGATEMNQESSRSHAILIIQIETTEVTGGLVKKRFSTLNLVDLAGSERQSHTKATGERLKEASTINKSLTVLGCCIRQLTTPGTKFISHRDSHLTHILKNSLGGNSKTAVIVNMHPDREYVLESSSTLQFAQSCTLIKNAVHRNEEMTGDQENSYKNAIQELRKEVDDTRAKAREEFAKELENAAELNRKIASENSALKAENAELRRKYDLALVKYLGTRNETSESIDLKNVVLNTGASHDFQTLTLEYEALKKHAASLQEELNEVRNRYQETLNETISSHTPAKPRRSSSRPKRRETQYRPSPSRLAELSVDSDAELRVQEAELKIASLETEMQSLRSKCEEVTEKEYQTQKRLGEELAKSKAEVADLMKEIDVYESEREELIGKVERSAKQLDDLLLKNANCCKTMNEQEAIHKKAEHKLKNDIRDLEVLLEETRNSVNPLADQLEQQLSIKSELVCSLEHDIKTKAETIEDLKTELSQTALDMSNYRASKRRLEESLDNEEHLKKTIENMKKAISEQFENHQLDLKNMRAKKEKEIESLKLSLDASEKMRKKQEAGVKQMRSEEQKKFDEKMASLERQFEESHINAMKKKEEEMKRQSISLVESAKMSSEQRIRELEEQNEALHKQHREDSEVLRGQLGSKQSKVGYIENLRKKHVVLEEENSRLRAENTRLISEKRESTRPALRSRNQ